MYLREESIRNVTDALQVYTNKIMTLVEDSSPHGKRSKQESPINRVITKKWQKAKEIVRKCE